MTTQSPYLSLRQAVRPAIFAHRLLADDQNRAARLVAECEELLQLSRELLKSAGQVRLLTPEPGQPDDRETQLLDAYADAAMGWAKVVGSLMALGGTLVGRGDWDNVRRLAIVLAEVGENSSAADLRNQLGRAVWHVHYNQLCRISNQMPPDEIRKSINALRAILLEVPEDFPDRNREVNRLLAPLASAIHAVMVENHVEIPYNSRVEHIATGGVASHPDIVKTSLDELSAEFEGTCGRRVEQAG
jgi:hypothetical protein